MTLISIGDLITHGFQDIMKTWKPTLKYTVWLLLAPVIWIVVFFFGMLQLGVSGSPNPIFLVLIGIGYIVMIVALIWASIGVMKYLLSYAHGHATTEPKRSPLSYVPSLLWVFLLTALPIILSWILAILPSLVLRNGVAIGLVTALLIIGAFLFNIWFGLMVSQASMLVLDDGARGIASLKESYAMVVNRWWKTLWRLLLPNLLFQMCISTAITVVYMVAFFIGIAVFGGWSAATGLGSAESMRASNVGFGLVGIVLAVVFALAMVVLTVVATVAGMLFQASVSARLYLSLKQTKIE